MVMWTHASADIDTFGLCLPSVVIAVDLPDVQLCPSGELDVHKNFRDVTTTC